MKRKEAERLIFDLEQGLLGVEQCSHGMARLKREYKAAKKAIFDILIKAESPKP